MRGLEYNLGNIFQVTVETMCKGLRWKGSDVTRDPVDVQHKNSSQGKDEL